MAKFDDCNRFFNGCSIPDLWRKDRFDAFVNDFGCDGASYYAPIDSVMFLFRFMAYKGQYPRHRKHEQYISVPEQYRLFDHSSSFRTKDGTHIIISMPYGTESQIMEAYQHMIKAHSELRPIDMYFIDNRYKYRKNGDHMLMFVWWTYGRSDRFPRYAMRRHKAFPTDNWSETESNNNKEENNHD